jgi:hypothetical protein
VQQSRAGMLYVLVILANWSDQSDAFIKIFDLVLR